MTATLAQTPLHSWHVAHGGRMVDFAGWSMPIQYGSIVAEHRATRTAVGLFDVSHMARLRFEGSGAEEFLDHLVTRRIAGMEVGQVRYALVTNHEGGIVDDVLVYRLAAADSGEPYFQMVVNSSNRRKIVTWIDANLAGREDVQFFDRTHETGMIAVQGPKALDGLRPHASNDPGALRYYHAVEAEVADAPAILSRTGYTGEDGWEVMLPADASVALWERLVDAGAGLGVQAAGLGARDTLRLEAAMHLYGHELNEDIDPFQAGLDFAVDLEGRSFPGYEALVAAKRNPDRPKRVGLESAGRIARERDEVLAGGESVGQVTSGTFSPTLERPIAMAYVQPRVAVVGQELEIVIRGKAQGARVVPLPFYRRRTTASSN